VKLTTHLCPVPMSKNWWSCTSTPQYAFMGWYSVEGSTGTTLPLPLPYFLPTPRPGSSTNFIWISHLPMRATCPVHVILHFIH
jgi:hypothetical protein